MKRKGTLRKGPSKIPLSQEQKTLVEDLLQTMGNRGADEVITRLPDPLCAQALVERLPLTESSLSLLAAVKDAFPNKAVNKAIKRTLYRLNKRGVSTEGFNTEDSDAPPILKPLPKDPPLCYVGPVNGTGTRALVLILHRSGQGRDTGFGIVSDSEGFQDFFFRALGKKDAKTMTAQFSEEAGPFVETSLSHAATILEETYQSHLKNQSAAPPGYLELRPWLLEAAPLLERPPIYDLLSESEVSEDPATDSKIRELFEHPMMTSWLIEFTELKPLLEEMSKVNESPIVLTDGQKTARLEEIQQKYAMDIFNEETRGRLKHRLEEMAYVFLKVGEEATARLALAAADASAGEATALRSNPVIEALLVRSLQFYTEAMKEGDLDNEPEEQDDSSIIRP